MTEINEVLTAKDPDFRVKEMSLWGDHCQSRPAAVGDTALEKANSRLESLSADARKAAWEHDCLLLAKDTANIAKLFSACEKSERAERLKKITHMRAENTIGSNIVESFMSKHACHKAGSESDLLTFVDQAQCWQTINALAEFLLRSVPMLSLCNYDSIMSEKTLQP